ncbi:MAG TPA: NUDIX domain-containing protein [Jatrophihabitantaceae bacterium]|jgi:ADP-ribose pyrophosphatase YjhB (NUDIX family)
MTPVPRVGGRALIVDDSGRLLLIHERLEGGGTHWLTPGGGVENGEHPRDAARREAFEETSVAVDLPDDAEPVLITRRDWSWAGVDYDQVDHFFLVRVPDGTPTAPRTLTDVERQTWLALRWWTEPELRETDEVLVPADLGTVLARVLRPGG